MQSSSPSPQGTSRAPAASSGFRELSKITHEHQEALLALRKAECRAQRAMLSNNASRTRDDFTSQIRERHQQVEQERKEAEQYLAAASKARSRQIHQIVEAERERKSGARRVFSAVYDARREEAAAVRQSLQALRQQRDQDRKELSQGKHEEKDMLKQSHRDRTYAAVEDLERQRNAARHARQRERAELKEIEAERNAAKDALAQQARERRLQSRESISRARQEVEERNAAVKAKMIADLRRVREEEIKNLKKLTAAFDNLGD
jgi:hypothetical protein